VGLIGRRRVPRAAFRYLAEDAPSGYGDAADRLVRGMRAAGVHLEYRSWPVGQRERGPRRAGPHRLDQRPGERAARRAPTVAHVVPEHLPRVRKAYRRGPLVAHTVWETDRLPAHWPELLNACDRVVVPTDWNHDVFVQSGVRAPVVVVPHVACDPVPGDGGVPLGIPPDTTVFYTIGRWDQRKAPAMVVRAFLEAFTADDPVALVVKTSMRAQFPAPGDWGKETDIRGLTMLEIARIIRDHPNPAHVHVETDDWSPTRIAGLHARGDCFVSLSHGEGWGLGAFDATAYGNPVVMTGWGGQLAYLDAQTAYLVDYDLEPTQHWLPRVYGPDQRWAVPRFEHAVERLREVAADLDAARRRAAPACDRVLDDYAPARVAATFLDVVPEVGTAVGTAVGAAVAGATASKDEETSRALREPLLVGVAVGRWRPAFDRWIARAERLGYQYEILGREVAEPYVAHATRWRLLRDFLATQPGDRLVLVLDMVDAVVGDDGAGVIDRYRAFGVPLVLLPEHGFVGEAGVAADALRDGYGLVDWEARGAVDDRLAMQRWLELPEHSHLAAVDHERTLPITASDEGADEEFGGPRSRGPKALRPVPMQAPMPRLAHFTFGLAADPEPFRLVHALALASCRKVVKPEVIQLHCRHLPSGAAWELVQQHVSVCPLEAGPLLGDDEVAVRLDLLTEHGGLSAELDTLFVGRFPERLWRTRAVVGRRAHERSHPGGGTPSTVMLMAQPGSEAAADLRVAIAADSPADAPGVVTPDVAAFLLECPAHDVDDAWIRDSPSAYAAAARPVLQALRRT